MSIEEIKKLVSEHPLDEKDFELYAVQMKIRIGLVTRNKVHDRRLAEDPTTTPVGTGSMIL